MHFFHAIGNSVDESEARAYIVNLRDHGIVSDAASRVISASISSGALDKVPREKKNEVRADILRHIILTLVK